MDDDKRVDDNKDWFKYDNLVGDNNVNNNDQVSGYSVGDKDYFGD